MLKTLKRLLFGEWVTLDSARMMGHFTTWMGEEVKHEGVAVIQRHSRTGERRAYFEKPNGEKFDISYNYAISLLEDKKSGNEQKN